MFETSDDTGLVAMIEETTRDEAAAGARRAAAIAELVSRRVGDDANDPRAWWACDLWDSAAAEIAAAMNISHRKASGQMRIAETLRDHLPAVAALFSQGRLSVRVISAITWRTRLITDEQVWARIDTALAERAQQWGPLADEKLIAAVDGLVLRFDPSAVIASRAAARTRDFTVGDWEDEDGLVSVRGKLSGPDAAVLDKKVAAITATVCDNDPRSVGERRADGAGAWANGNDHLPCRCGLSTCPVAGRPAPKSSVVVNVLADQAAIDAAQSASVTDQAPAQAASQPAPPAPPARGADAGTAILSGTEMLPTSVLAELLRNGAKLRPLCAGTEDPETRYRPSTPLANFVRCRDLTCRFPGCTVPAERCDIDHVVPYPIGATHAANLACLCRKHHHLKTFWTGDWALALLPDGAAIWTSPTGGTYTTHPGSRSHFPQWDTTSGGLPLPRQSETFSVGRGLMMPRRSRTRAAERAARIKAEREQKNSDPPSNSDPPPF